MRTTSDDDIVRLYHLDTDSGSATTLLYGPLRDALAAAATYPAEMQADLFLQTSNDVVSYVDLSTD
ncbi:hypothetical protein [Sphingomonas sp.]|uniref:hypothetical protein n=1 Tax=Sphingomonas sp. TaxID=28214 RepID=UPI0035BBDF18